MAGASPVLARTEGESAARTQFALNFLRRVCVLPNPWDSPRVRTETVLTTYGYQKISHVLARRQHVVARTAGCALSFRIRRMGNFINLAVTPAAKLSLTKREKKRIQNRFKHAFV